MGVGALPGVIPHERKLAASSSCLVIRLVHVVVELRSWFEDTELRRRVSVRGREGKGTQAVAMLLTAPSRSPDGEQSELALTSIDRAPDMGDEVCNEGHGQA